MISIKPITSDYAEYMLATEYYLGKDGVKQETLRWGGKGLSDRLFGASAGGFGVGPGGLSAGGVARPGVF